MSEVIFEVHEDMSDGGLTASALGFGIHTEADTLGRSSQPAIAHVFMHLSLIHICSGGFDALKIDLKDLLERTMKWAQTGSGSLRE